MSEPVIIFKAYYRDAANHLVIERHPDLEAAQAAVSGGVTGRGTVLQLSVNDLTVLLGEWFCGGRGEAWQDLTVPPAAAPEPAPAG